ncbi:malonyl-ACP O-methyltransferase BioC [Thermoflavimicrobium daqui]|jgi:malonyl-CoA O-methyltransferase|uniref:Malonyl-[acyl-carrier protein] O-methyltransferase n=1 Tax=Thermoflavimicrobium daqui TaxID=2137476 RepID=A0A364K802_9BACL|nr:malonyl-ACP O-methyltransferase BioC [Thermoflavimicrobium daqui]RAL26431.1 malonyl-[acyl-carrier protein] O-methyltransferase BioC [Thermoflavimicrobium daqui]
MYMTKTRIVKQFNRAVHTYDQYADVQKQMAGRLISILPLLKKDLRILEVGCGTGILTRLLAKQFPHATILAIDLAEEMIKKAQMGWASSSHIRFQVADGEGNDWVQEGPFDLIISNATIQWFSKPQVAFKNFRRALKMGGWFLASTFGPKTFQELTALFCDLEQKLQIPPSQHQLSMPDRTTWEARLQKEKFIEVKTKEELYQLEYPDCYTFLKAVKAVGASYSENTLSFSQTRKLLQCVMENYNQKYKTNQGVYTTYQVYYLIGRK